MRFIKVTLLLTIFGFFSAPAYANKLFYKTNSDLKRVGLDEIKKISSVDFESGNYRLDSDFQLGYGDTLSISLWGKLEANHRLTIDRDGNIVIPLLGKIAVAGLTLPQARLAVKEELDKKYSNVEFTADLVEVQNIRINILGDAEKPGPYAVSPFCTMVEALAKSGGPAQTGSLSEIKLIREEKEIVSFNAYDFLFKGDRTKNVRLKHGDTIFIPPIGKLIAVRGDVLRPGIYETTVASTLNNAIETAGGALSARFKRKAVILRVNPDTKLTEIFKEIDFDSSKEIVPAEDIQLEGEDTVTITTALDYTPSPVDLFKTINISGEVNSPGDYLIREATNLSSLLKRAGGLKESGFVQGAVFTRRIVRDKQKSILDDMIRAYERSILEEEARLAESVITREERKLYQRAIENRRRALNLMAARVPEGRIIIDLEEIMNGKSDIVLKNGDEIYIPTIPDWVLVAGAVYNPESVVFIKGKTLDYYINMVGGATRLADSEAIYIIKANGRAESKTTGYGEISRGDIIVVPEKME